MNTTRRTRDEGRGTGEERSNRFSVVSNQCRLSGLGRRTSRLGLATALAFGLAAGWICVLDARAQNDDHIGNEYRVTLFPYHRISDRLTGFGYLGYVNNPDKEYQTGYLGYGANYSFNRAFQLWAGLIGTYTANENSADKLELRPFIGPKLFLPNDWKWNIYNFTRYEYRAIQDRDTHDWNGIHRLRSRFGVEFPLTSREKAWQPKTWYGLADVEPFFRFDRDTVDPLRVRGGIAYIVSNRVRIELIYHAQFTRPTGSSGLEYTDNIFRLNIKIALNKGLMQRVFDGGDADD
jgi:hypothetical protein